MSERCATCTFWRWNHSGPDYHNDSLEMQSFMRGTCQRHAPLLDANGRDALTRQWPLTAGTDWCGDWQRAFLRGPQA